MKMLIDGQWKQYRIQFKNYEFDNLKCTIPPDLKAALLRVTGKPDCEIDIDMSETLPLLSAGHLEYLATGYSLSDDEERPYAVLSELPIKLAQRKRRTIKEMVEWDIASI